MAPCRPNRAPTGRQPCWSGEGGLRDHTASLFLGVALLRLVIVPGLISARPLRAAAPHSFNRPLRPSPGPDRQTSVVPAKSEGIGESDLHRAFDDTVLAIVEVTIRIWIGQVYRGRNPAPAGIPKP